MVLICEIIDDENDDEIIQILTPCSWRLCSTYEKITASILIKHQGKLKCFPNYISICHKNLMFWPHKQISFRSHTNTTIFLTEWKIQQLWPNWSSCSRIAGIPAKIRPKHLQHTSQKCYCLSQPACYIHH
jgi:hypothetical protein